MAKQGPALSGNSLRFDARPGRFDWFFFAGAQGRVIAHNIFLDGKTFKDSADRFGSAQVSVRY